MPNLRKQLTDAHHEIRVLKNNRETTEWPLRHRIQTLEAEAVALKRQLTAAQADLRAIQLFSEYVASRARQAAGDLAASSDVAHLATGNQP